MEKNTKTILMVLGIIVVGYFIFKGKVPFLGAIQTPSCSFITNAVDENSYKSGVCINVDRAGDGITEGYKYSSVTTRTCSEADLIVTTPAGHGVYRGGTTNDVYLMKNKGTSGYKFVRDTSCDYLTCCQATIWNPVTSTVCLGETFTQTSDCGTTRSAIGTKDCRVCITTNDLQIEINRYILNPCGG